MRVLNECVDYISIYVCKVALGGSGSPVSKLENLVLRYIFDRHLIYVSQAFDLCVTRFGCPAILKSKRVPKGFAFTDDGKTISEELPYLNSYLQLP